MSGYASSRATLVSLFLCGAGSVWAKDAGAYDLRIPLGLDAPAIPQDNPLSEKKVELGRRLFFEKKLSRNGAVSCASCHDPGKSFQNGERVATGVDGRRGRLNVPVLFNRAYGTIQFWDGRAASLEDQVGGPLENPNEMGNTWEAVLKLLNDSESYRSLFAQVFDGPPSKRNVAMAISAFERTLLSGNSAYDRYRAGKKDAMTPLARLGAVLFHEKYRCSQCHSGPNFTDEKLSQRCYPAYANHDPSVNAGSRSKPLSPSVKTPTLRNVALSAPYLHNGSLTTLDQVLDFYNFTSTYWTRPIRETAPVEIPADEKRALIAFLESLTGAAAP